MIQHELNDAVDAFRDELDRSGMHAALRFLNGRTPHRFTGIYAFDAPSLRSIRLFDRENPDLEIGANAPLRETYCSITGESRAPFRSDDTRVDPRLADHPARETVISYCGVPLGDHGTLCHFDLTPRDAHAKDVPLMQAAASILLERLAEEGALPLARDRSAPTPPRDDLSAAVRDVVRGAGNDARI